MVTIAQKEGNVANVHVMKKEHRGSSGAKNGGGKLCQVPIFFLGGVAPKMSIIDVVKESNSTINESDSLSYKTRRFWNTRA